MALKVQASFSAGELDPALRERTTLEKYASGLATGRNAVVGKTGRLVSRHARRYFENTKLTDREVVIHSMSHNGCFLEWGHQYVRIYSLDGTLIGDHAHAFTEADLPLIQFTDLDFDHVLIMLEGQNPLVLSVNPASDGFKNDFFEIPDQPLFGSIGLNNGSGYLVQYLVSAVIKGEESFTQVCLPDVNIRLPIASGQSNEVYGVYDDADLDPGDDIDDVLQEFRFYRRPFQGGSYGYIGSTTYFDVNGSDREGYFLDVGQEADYSHLPPTLNKTIRDNSLGTPEALQSKTGTVYQQRLLLSYGDRIETSRTGYLGNFYRDYPLGTDSSLSFKSGSKGYAKILRMIDNDGLVVFTSEGVFLHLGALSTTNISLEKKGNWVIDERVPPIAIPGGVLFVDSLTNTVRQLMWSQEAGAYIGEELSIFSNHLFEKKRIKSWCFQEGDFPLLWVVFSDGSYATFTYEREHLMRAWMRHDSQTPVEYVASTFNGVNINTTPYEKIPGQVIFVVKKGNIRQIELVIPRYVSAAIASENPESDKNESIMAADGVVSWEHMILDDLTNDNLELVPVGSEPDPNFMEGQIYMRTTDDGIFTNPGIGAVGTVFRWFDPDDHSAIDLTVISRTNNNEVIVQPNVPFPRVYDENPRLYECRDVITGLLSLEGESVSVVGDGYVLASPNNNIQDFPEYIPVSGEITLEDKYAIVHVGRPYTCDIETLDVATIEQSPALIESQTVNKLYVKTYRSRGLYIGSRFPDNDLVEGDDVTGTAMVALEGMDTYDVNYEDEIPIIGNRYPQPNSKRHEITLPGDWKSNGRVCLRQVDPLHWEILSIIPDAVVERREGDR